MNQKPFRSGMNPTQHPNPTQSQPQSQPVMPQNHIPGTPRNANGQAAQSQPIMPQNHIPGTERAANGANGANGQAMQQNIPRTQTQANGQQSQQPTVSRTGAGSGTGTANPSRANQTQANQSRGRKAGRRLVPLIFLGIFLAILAVGGSAAAAVWLHKPSVESSSPAFTTTIAAPSGERSGGNPEEGGAPVVENAYKRKKDVYNFLLTGLDASGENHTDVLLLVQYDVAAQSAAILSIPRDTYINVGRNFSKLNSYYTGEYNRILKTGLRGEDVKIEAMKSLVALLEENLAVEIDWWAQVNLEGFRNIVDIFGGVDIEIAVDMEYTDPEQSLIIDLTPGRHTLTGYESEQFVRFREGYKTADKGRINAQKIFISAFIDTVKRKLTVSMIDDLLKEAQKNLLTDISLLDCAYFARSALTGLDMENIYMVTLPGEGVQNDETGAWYEVIYRADALALINEHFNVYTADVTDSMFDSDGVFTNTDKSYIDAIYRTPAGTASAGASAASIEEDMVDMQRDMFYSDYLQ